MKALIRKEIYQLFTSNKASIIEILIMLILSVIFEIHPISEFNVFFTITFMSLGIFSSDSISRDEKSRWDIYSLSLPYKKSDIVLSKYILFALISISSAMIFMIPNIIFDIISHQHIDVNILYLTICGISMSFTIAALSHPFIFALESSKGLTAFFISIFLAGFIFAMCYIKIYDVKKIEIGIMNTKYHIKYIAAAVISTVISIPLSIILFKRRQFK